MLIHFFRQLFPKRRRPASLMPHHQIALVFRHEHRFLFEPGMHGALMPRTIELAEDACVEDDLLYLERYLFDEFGLDPDVISVKPRYSVATLWPVFPVTYSLAIVDFQLPEFEQMAPHFVEVLASKLLLESDANFFFQLIARECFDGVR